MVTIQLKSNIAIAYLSSLCPPRPDSRLGVKVSGDLYGLWFMRERPLSLATLSELCPRDFGRQEHRVGGTSDRQDAGRKESMSLGFRLLSSGKLAVRVVVLPRMST